jgi:transposase
MSPSPLAGEGWDGGGGLDQISSPICFLAKYNHESFDECWDPDGMRPLHRPPVTPTPRKHLDRLDRTTKTPRLRTRAQMLWLAAAQGLKGPQSARLVREREATVLRWLKRSRAAGMEGLHAAPRPGRPAQMTEAYKAELLAAVRRRPRRLGLPCSLGTLQRLVAALAERTGMRVSDDTGRRALKRAGLVLRRPQHQRRRPAPDWQVNNRRVQTPATT